MTAGKSIGWLACAVIACGGRLAVECIGASPDAAVKIDTRRRGRLDVVQRAILAARSTGRSRSGPC